MLLVARPLHLATSWSRSLGVIASSTTVVARTGGGSRMKRQQQQQQARSLSQRGISHFFPSNGVKKARQEGEPGDKLKVRVDLLG